jgi:hypothetical protein
VRIYNSLLFLLTISSYVYSQQWQLPTGHIYKKWAENVTPQNVLPEYPRPQMVRNNWLVLEGFRDYAILAKDTDVQIDNIKLNKS